MKAYVLNKVGDVSNFEIRDIEEPKYVGPNDVLIQHEAIGINFDDILYRNGTYSFPEGWHCPIMLGMEGVGRVLMKGENVSRLKIDDMVGYAFAPLGAYVDKRVIDYRYLITIPSNITSEVAAGVLRKGLLAQTLLFNAVNLNKDDWILIHSVAGGVGHLMAKWAKSCGLHIIGTVGSDSKKSIALATGCDVVINRKNESVFETVMRVTNNQGVKVVYDGIGKPVCGESIKSVKPCGIYVSYGYSGGIIDNMNIMKMRGRSLFFTTPMLELYKHNRYELVYSAGILFDALQKGSIAPNISRYAFNDIAQAHSDLESGKTIGSLVVNCW